MRFTFKKKKKGKNHYGITFYSHFNYHLIITQPRTCKVLYPWEQYINMTTGASMCLGEEERIEAPYK